MKVRSWLLSLTIFLFCMGSLHASSFTPREIYAKDAPAVVFISAFDMGSPSGNAGTGTIITQDGLVLTNSHVVTNPNKKRLYGNIVVCLKPARLTGEAKEDLSQCLPAHVVSMDSKLDLTVLRLENVQKVLPTMPIGDVSDVSTGDSVAAIGHPEGGGLWILTTGVISGIKKIGPQEVFQTEASINRGNSGGPLINSSGKMIGINTSMSRKSSDGIAIVGVNFAVKSSQVKKWLDTQGINIAVQSSASQGSIENMGLAHFEKSEIPKDSVQPLADKKKAKPSEALTQVPEVKKAPASEPEVKKPEKHIVEAEDEIKEFKGPDGEIMYGIPGGKFSLSDSTRILYDRTKKNAEKAFEELDEAK
jgi:serine protease Do